jgi:hypothetical protein
VKKLRSSIFNFETLVLGGVEAQALAKAVILSALLIVLAEGSARFLLLSHSVRYWEYWSPGAAAKFEGFKAVEASGHAPAVVIVGDSTAALNIDPNVVVSELEARVEAYNLAESANYPIAFASTTLPLLSEPNPAPKMLVVSFSARSLFHDGTPFDRFEARILDSPLYECEHSRFIPSCLYLTQLLPAVGYLRDAERGPRLVKEAVRARGFISDPGDSRSSPTSAAQATELGGGSQSLGPDRFGVIESLVDLARRRGITLVLVLGPQRRPSASVAVMERAFQRFGRAGSALVLDMREPPGLTPGDFWDDIHLSHDGARLYSRILGRALGPLVADGRR